MGDNYFNFLDDLLVLKHSLTVCLFIAAISSYVGWPILLRNP